MYSFIIQKNGFKTVFLGLYFGRLSKIGVPLVIPIHFKLMDFSIIHPGVDFHVYLLPFLQSLGYIFFPIHLVWTRRVLPSVSKSVISRLSLMETPSTTCWLSVTIVFLHSDTKLIALG